MSGMQTGTAAIRGPRVLELSEQGRSALLSTGANREGAVLGRGVAATAAQELILAGLVGQKRGLTRAGVIQRELLLETMMRELF